MRISSHGRNTTRPVMSRYIAEVCRPGFAGQAAPAAVPPVSLVDQKRDARSQRISSASSLHAPDSLLISPRQRRANNFATTRSKIHDRRSASERHPGASFASQSFGA